MIRVTVTGTYGYKTSYTDQNFIDVDELTFCAARLLADTTGESYYMDVTDDDGSYSRGTVYSGVSGLGDALGEFIAAQDGIR
jgi:hypothetical protein